MQNELVEYRLEEISVAELLNELNKGITIVETL
jgi:hypothetical protein